MLLDQCMPNYHFSEIHETSISASAERVFGVLREVTLDELPLFRVLVTLRALPARLAGRSRLVLNRGETLVSWAQRSGFELLGEVPNEELLFVTVGQFWRVLGSRSSRVVNAGQFPSFLPRSYVKVATNFRLSKISLGSTRIMTETRVYPVDSNALRKFSRYWRIIQPGSALIRREWLRAIKRRAER